MRTLAVLMLLLSAVLIVPGVAAQEADGKPTVAILRFGPMFNFSLIQDSMLGMLASTGLISQAEAVTDFSAGAELDGEKVRMLMGDAALSFANLNFVVEAALDQGAQALVTFSTPMTLAALNATLDLDEPPAILFASVFNPYAAGIAQSSCLKPAHVTGVQSVTPYEDIVPLLLLQDPTIKTVGTIYSSSETSGRLGAETIAAIAEAQGLQVEVAAITAISDLIPAAEGLVAKGVEAFLIPSDLLTVAGLPSLMQVAIDSGIPVFHATANSLNDGATVSAGVSEADRQGRLLGSLLAGYLSGELDIRRTGIGTVSSLTIGVNLDTAAQQGIEIAEALIERADAILKDGAASGRQVIAALERLGLAPEVIEQVAPAITAALAGGGKAELDLPPEVSAIVQQALAAQSMQTNIEAALAELRCTDEMIAEQQAELDAAEA